MFNSFGSCNNVNGSAQNGSIFPSHFSPPSGQNVDYPSLNTQSSINRTLESINRTSELFNRAQELLGIPTQMTSPSLGNFRSGSQQPSTSNSSFAPRFDFSDRSWNIGNTHNHTNVVQGSARKSPEEIREEKERREKANRIKTGIVATLILGVGAAVGTYFFTKTSNLNQDIKEWKEGVKVWEKNYSPHLTLTQKETAEVVFKEIKNVLQTKKNALNVKVGLAAAAALSGLLILGGALAAVPSLVVGGAISVGVVSIVFACHLIHSFASDSLQRSKRNVEENIKNFNGPAWTPHFYS